MAGTGPPGVRPDRETAGWLADTRQTALAKAYVAWRRVSRADDPDAYLRRILVNASNRRFRKRRVTEQPGDLPEVAVEGPADLVGERAALPQRCASCHRGSARSSSCATGTT